MSKEQAIRALVGHIDAYMSGLDGPGIDEVRAGIGRWSGGAVAPSESPSLAVLDYLAPALEFLRNDGHGALADAIAAASPFLPWGTYDLYPRAEIGEDFADGHAFASIIGEEAPITAVDYDLGLFLIAPHVFYRDHNHAAPELYAPLTGPHGWRFSSGAPLTWAPANRPVWNPPWRPHAIKTGDVPFLCIFGWTKDVMQPAKIIREPDWAEFEVPFST